MAIRRLTESEGVALTEDVVGQRLRVAVRRDVVAFLADLLDSSRADRNAGLMAFNATLPYAEGTLGARIKAIVTGIGEGQSWADVDALVADLEGRLDLSSLDPALQDRIDLIDAAVTEVGSVNYRLAASADVLSEQISDEVQNRALAVSNAVGLLRTEYQLADTGLGGRVTTETLERTGADLALGLRVDSVTARLNTGDIATTLASAVSYAYTKAQTDGAISASAIALRAEYAAADQVVDARVTTESIASSNRDLALGVRVDNVSARLNTGDIATSLASAQTYAYTKAQTDSAISTASTTLRSEYQSADLGISNRLNPGGDIASSLAYASTYAYTKAQTDGAVSTASTTLRSEFQSADLGISNRLNPGGDIATSLASALTYAYTKAQTDSAISTAATRLAASMGGGTLTADPEFQLPTEAWSLPPFVSVVGGSRPGRGAFQASEQSEIYSARALPIDPSRQYRVLANVRRGGGAPATRVAYVGVALQDVNGTNINGDGTFWLYSYAGQEPPTTFQQVGGVFGAGTPRAFPGNAVTMKVIALLMYDATGSAPLIGFHQVEALRIEDAEVARASQALGAVITSESTASVGRDEALGVRVDNVTARLNSGDIATAIATAQTYAYTKAQTDSAISVASTTLRSEFNTADDGIRARLNSGGDIATAIATAQTYAYTKAQADSAVASSISSLRSEVAGPGGLIDARVDIEASTRASADGQLGAQYVLKVGATRSDGRKVFSQIGLASTVPTDGTGGQSEIIMMGGRLVFVPSDNVNADPANVFEVGSVNGVTTLTVPAARIGDLTVGSRTIANNATSKVLGSSTYYETLAQVTLVITSEQIPAGETSVPVTIIGSADTAGALPFFDISFFASGSQDWSVPGNLVAAQPNPGVGASVHVVSLGPGTWVIGAYNHGGPSSGSAFDPYARVRSVAVFMAIK